MGSGYPAGWREWRRLVADGEYEDDRALNRFAARFRMASGMRAVTYPSMGRATAEGYSVALRVALAYTALEAWEKAMGRGKQTVVEDADLAGDFRGPGLTRLRAHLVAASRSGLRGRVALVIEADDITDVRPVAEALRNVVFHGDFTPGGAGLARSGAARTWTRRLSDSVLDTVEADFAAWVADV